MKRLFLMISVLSMVGCAQMIPRPSHIQTMMVAQSPKDAFQLSMQTALAQSDGYIQSDASTGILRVTTMDAGTLTVIIRPAPSGSQIEVSGKPGLYTPWADGGVKAFIEGYQRKSS
jgi:hypothetical protein